MDLTWEPSLADLYTDEAFLRVAFHADDGCLGVFFWALHNLNYISGSPH